MLKFFRLHDQEVTAEATQATAERSEPTQAPEQTTEPTREGIQKFHDMLPESLRSDPTLLKYNDLGALAEAHVHAQRKLGVKADRLAEIPEDMVSEDGQKQFRVLMERLGLPGTLDGYEVQAPENAPEWLSLKTELGKGFLASMHEAGVLPKQAERVYGYLVQQLSAGDAEMRAAAQQREDTNIATLKEEFGPAYDGRRAAAEYAIDKVGGEALAQRLKEAGLANDPVVVKAFSALGVQMDEKAAPASGSTGGRFGNVNTPAQLRAQARELMQQAMREKDPAISRQLSAKSAALYKAAYSD